MRGKKIDRRRQSHDLVVFFFFLELRATRLFTLIPHNVNYDPGRTHKPMSNSAPISTAEAMRIEGDLRVVDVEVRAALSTGQYQDLAAAFAHGVSSFLRVFELESIGLFSSRFIQERNSRIRT